MSNVRTASEAQKGLSQAFKVAFSGGAIMGLMVVMISIDCTGVEDELDVTMAQRSELDYLIYNDPLGYADLILNGDPKEYLKT